ncbi:hypothetical protein MMC29_003333 [Sticta canariensis]|nr:hypothetical protein [Sticta canariensis]
MSNQSMHKSMARGGGGGESSSGTRRHQLPRDGDYETALRLRKLMDEETGYSNYRRHPQKEYPTDSRSLGKAAKPHHASSRDHAAPYPKEIQLALDEVQKFIAGVMETTCRKCDSPLMRDFNVHRWFKQWTSAKGQPQPTSICSLTCPQKEYQALTCLGCGEKPRLGKFTGKIDGFRLDWCCESGQLFAIWSFLCESDDFELAEQGWSQRQVNQSLKQPTRNEITSSKQNGTGYSLEAEGIHGLFKISTGENLEGKGKTRASHHLTLGQGEDSTSSSLLACISKLGIQSEALLKASRAVKSEFRTASAQDLLEVTERVTKLQLSMKPHSGSSSKSDREMTWKEYNQKYCMTREENVLRNVQRSLIALASSFHYSQPNRIKRLVTEASEMETSLPPNISVKVDEVRPDVMKCLIVGPEDTPYEAGLFECASTLSTPDFEREN